MVEKVGNPQPPTGLRRFAFRMPIKLYQWKMGGLMGQRFLLLNHIGRKSGKSRQVVLEVVDHIEADNPMADVYFVASGFGPKSDWYKNLQAHPEVEIQIGRKKMSVTAEMLDADASGNKMVQYSHDHPKAAAELMRLIGYKVDGSDEDWYTVGHDYIPFVRFQPRLAS